MLFIYRSLGFVVGCDHLRRLYPALFWPSESENFRLSLSSFVFQELLAKIESSST